MTNYPCRQTCGTSSTLLFQAPSQRWRPTYCVLQQGEAGSSQEQRVVLSSQRLGTSLVTLLHAQQHQGDAGSRHTWSWHAANYSRPYKI